MRKLIILILLPLVFSCGESGKKTSGGKATSPNQLAIKENSDEPEQLQPVRVITYDEVLQHIEYYFDYYDEPWEILSLFKDLSAQFRNMLPSELRLLRNEFFAREGYIFKSEDLAAYFSKRSWYEERFHTLDSIHLPSLQIQIIDTIKYYENENAGLTDADLKSRMLSLFNEKKEYNRFLSEWHVDIAPTLFRRNLGYQIKGIHLDAERNGFNRDWYQGENLRIKILDTSKQDILVMGCFQEIMCPAEYCLSAGFLFTCNKEFILIDYQWHNFEWYDQIHSDEKLIYKFSYEVSDTSSWKVEIAEDGMIK